MRFAKILHINMLKDAARNGIIYVSAYINII
jgi:hypothetical protein